MGGLGCSVADTSAQVHSTLPTLLFQHVSWAVTANALTRLMGRLLSLQARVVIRNCCPAA